MKSIASRRRSAQRQRFNRRMVTTSHRLPGDNTSLKRQRRAEANTPSLALQACTVRRTTEVQPADLGTGAAFSAVWLAGCVAIAERSRARFVMITSEIALMP